MNTLRTIWQTMGKKVVIVLAGLVLDWLRAKFPGASLPSTDTIREAVAALLGAHTLTDIVAIVKTKALEQMKVRQ